MIGQTEECEMSGTSAIGSCAKVAVSQDLWPDPSSVRVSLANECSSGWHIDWTWALGRLDQIYVHDMRVNIL